MTRKSVLCWVGVFIGVVGLTGRMGLGQSIEARINALVADPKLKGAQVSVHVAEVVRGQKEAVVGIYGHNANLPLAPASCTKLLTTAAAFERFGPKAVLKTHLYKVGSDLVLVGSGDPGFADAKLAAARGEKVTDTFDGWASALQKGGMTTFRHLYIDDRIFDQQFVHPDWPTNQLLAWYEAPVGGLNFNVNCLDWIPKLTAQGVGAELIPPTSYVSVTSKAKRGTSSQIWMWRPANENRFELRGTLAASASAAESVTIVDPGMWTGTILRDRLVANGITSTGEVLRITEGKVQGQLVASHETPLIDILTRANKNSVNMMAEGLCKRLGYEATQTQGTWENGTAAVEAYTQSVGVAKGLVKMADGSGLSANNRVAAQAFTTVLAHVAARADGDQYVETLAMTGEDSTLKKRFKAYPAVAKAVHAKTGHIAGVSALSGYVDVGRRRFAFSILINQSKYPGDMNLWQEKVVAEVYEWAGGK